MRVVFTGTGVLIAKTFLLTGFIGVFIGVTAPLLFGSSSGKIELCSSSLLSRCSVKLPYEDTEKVSLLDLRFFFTFFIRTLPFKVTPGN